MLYLKCPKLNTMKHFVTLAALLTSLSAFAQTPYNPDSDATQHIAVNDLQSILAVYGNSFSSGFVSDSASLAVLEVNTSSCINYQFVAPSEFQGTVLVFDGSLREDCDSKDFVVDLRTVDYGWIQPFNGLRFVFLRSPGQNRVIITTRDQSGDFEFVVRRFPIENSYDFWDGNIQGYFAQVPCETSQYGCGEPFYSISSIVFWNGNWYLEN